uniref:Uncharacterized protein n=1 Tax=Glossina austeni TaxID=7395 RepID=A0A1A9UWF0_GLOAU
MIHTPSRASRSQTDTIVDLLMADDEHLDNIVISNTQSNSTCAEIFPGSIKLRLFWLNCPEAWFIHKQKANLRPNALLKMQLSTRAKSSNEIAPISSQQCQATTLLQHFVKSQAAFCETVSKLTNRSESPRRPGSCDNPNWLCRYHYRVRSQARNGKSENTKLILEVPDLMKETKKIKEKYLYSSTKYSISTKSFFRLRSIPWNSQ